MIMISLVDIISVSLVKVIHILRIEVELIFEGFRGLVFRGPGGGERTHALEQKLFRLQEELTELHKKRGEVSPS